MPTTLATEDVLRVICDSSLIVAKTVDTPLKMSAVEADVTSETDVSSHEEVHGRQKGRARERKKRIVATPELYVDSLDLSRGPLHAARSLHLPLLERPHVSEQQCRALRKWSMSVMHRCLPNGMHNLRAANLSTLPFDASTLCSLGLCLVESAVGDLQRKMEEANVHAIQNGYCRKEAQRLVLKLNLTNFEAVDAQAEAALGMHLDALCRSVAEFDNVLGCGGWKLLQQARRELRDWLVEESLDCRTLDIEEAFEQVKERLPPELDEAISSRAALMAVASHDAVRVSLARDACGDRGENMLLLKLREAGMSREEFLTEDELRDVQIQQFGKTTYSTPDVLFRQGHLVNGTSMVHWIDSKGSCLLPGLSFGSQQTRLRKQLAQYVEFFGPGLIVWQGGFATAVTDGLQGVHVASWRPLDLMKCSTDAKEIGHTPWQ